MMKFIILLSTNFGAFAMISIPLDTLPPIAYISDVPKLITQHGYICETHEVTTSDGYILTLHRIPNGTNKNANCTCREVVILLHGLFCNAAVWVIQGPNDSLAFLLAEKCYDVWMVNFRGTDQSQKHVKYNADTFPQLYWNFSFHEMGLYDIIAAISYILSKTGKENCTIICHSQGCTALSTAAILLPNLTSIVKVACFMAPAVYMNNTRNEAVRYMAKMEPVIRPLILTTGYQKCSINDNSFMREAAIIFCTSGMTQSYCTLFLGYVFDTKGTNETALSMIWEYVQTTVSCKQLNHYFQFINSGYFCEYNNRPPGSTALFGSSGPSCYDLSKVKFPVCFFYAMNDKMVDSRDVERMMSEIPISSIIAKHFIDVTDFSHLDFVLGKNVTEIVNNKLIQGLEAFFNKNCT